MLQSLDIDEYGGRFVYFPHLYGIAAVYSKVSLGLVVEADGKVKYVKADSPVDKAGLKEGMQVLSINGVQCQNYLILQQEVGIKNPGDVITIEYLDSSKERGKVSIKLESN